MPNLSRQGGSPPKGKRSGATEQDGPPMLHSACQAHRHHHSMILNCKKTEASAWGGDYSEASPEIPK